MKSPEDLVVNIWADWYHGSSRIMLKTHPGATMPAKFGAAAGAAFQVAVEAAFEVVVEVAFAVAPTYSELCVVYGGAAAGTCVVL